MVRLESLNFVLKEITTFVVTYNIAEITASSQSYIDSLSNAPSNRMVENAISFYREFIPVFKMFDTTLWTDDELNILDILNLNNILGRNKDTMLSQFINGIISGRDYSNALTHMRAFNSLLPPITFAVQTYDHLKIFDIDNIADRQTSYDESIIEINFNNGVVIDDFKDAKEQMSDWYLIIEAYSRLLSEDRSDFEIVGFSKNSPTTVKVKAKIEIVAAMIIFSTAIVELATEYLKHAQTIKQIENSPLLTKDDIDIHLKLYRDRLEESTQKSIEKLVSENVEKRYLEHESKHDIHNVVNKGIRKQFNFYVNGGNVNFHIESDNNKEILDGYELKKNELIKSSEILKLNPKQKLIEENYDPPLDDKEETGNLKDL
jgi:hypothetical protein